MALIAPEIGIDLGTSNTMVYVRGRGIVVSEPTIVVIDSDNKHNVRAVGDEAEILLGRTGGKRRGRWKMRKERTVSHE